jgi:catechol 2,3-dioxygenase-like lactoylglutathione lyase family enzyme
MLIDHIDLRVKDLATARPLYDALMSAMGYSRFDVRGSDINYHQPDKEWSQAFFGLMADPDHQPNGLRIAFRASSREEVDRLAEVARAAGARDVDGPEPYGGSPRYYAVFFEDVDGNKLEICYRE